MVSFSTESLMNFKLSNHYTLEVGGEVEVERNDKDSNSEHENRLLVLSLNLMYQIPF